MLTLRKSRFNRSVQVHADSLQRPMGAQKIQQFCTLRQTFWGDNLVIQEKNQIAGLIDSLRQFRNVRYIRLVMRNR